MQQERTTLSSRNEKKENNLPLTGYDAAAGNVPLIGDSQEEALPTVKKGASAAISGAVAEVLASHFVKAIMSAALGGITSTSEAKSASEARSAAAAETSAPPQSSSALGSPANVTTAAHPNTCGRQVQAGMHGYERD